ncbi:hypothetical protein [Aneurinibacillus terranovensis]|uniref:hypothetical protein n=1 Tax=Aneurinibacillus terranovensis TaxID=278991 RepID=UPI000418D21D|nr:hypothetical protein [Aneurinibacillus terranovensis]
MKKIIVFLICLLLLSFSLAPVTWAQTGGQLIIINKSTNWLAFYLEITLFHHLLVLR